MEFSAEFLREVAAEITKPLTYLYNFSLQSGTIPSDWKQSSVTTVYTINMDHVMTLPTIGKFLWFQSLLKY